MMVFMLKEKASLTSSSFVKLVKTIAVWGAQKNNTFQKDAILSLETLAAPFLKVFKMFKAPETVRNLSRCIGKGEKMKTTLYKI